MMLGALKEPIHPQSGSDNSFDQLINISPDHSKCHIDTHDSDEVLEDVFVDMFGSIPPLPANTSPTSLNAAKVGEASTSVNPLVKEYLDYCS